jgi:hypothetical protein
MFNIDEIKDKINGLKEQVEIIKEADGVVFKITDPEAKAEFDPTQIENLKNMMPGGSAMEIEAIAVEGGYKLKTSDPEGLYQLFMQIFDPGFLEMMLKQLMEMFSKMGDALAGSMEGLAGSMGDLAGGLTGLGNQDAQVEPEQEKPRSPSGGPRKKQKEAAAAAAAGTPPSTKPAKIVKETKAEKPIKNVKHPRKK